MDPHRAHDKRRSAFETARAELDALLADRPSRDDALRGAVRIMYDATAHYHWVGIYLVDGGELQVHNYLGRPTPHERIPMDKGICGAAIRDNDTVIVDDVHSDPRYLACNIETASEIVVPIRVAGQAVGEIDIDSDDRAAFGDADRRFIEAVAERLAPLLG